MGNRQPSTQPPPVPSGSKPAKEYVINLDTAPEDRWKQIGLDYKGDIQEAVDTLKKNVPEAVVLLIDKIGEDLEKLLPSLYKEELLGLAEAAEVPVGELFLFNLSYDITARCTSVVAQATNGKVLHGRNLDTPGDKAFQSVMDIARKMVITVHFQRAGKTIYTGTTIAGMIGLATGQKPNSFTITLNERRTGTYWTNILHLIYDSPGAEVMLVIRNALADPDINFQGVLNRMTYIPLIAACYITIAGTKPGEGAVISRDRNEAVKPFSNGIWKLDAASGRWYLLQTNCDHWTAPPDLGPTSSNPDNPKTLQWAYERETAGNEAMDKISQNNINAQSLVTVLSTEPVLNPETLYTTVMSAADPSLFKSWIRNVKEEEQTTEGQTEEQQTAEGQTEELQAAEGQTEEQQTTGGQTEEPQTTEGQKQEEQTTEGKESAAEPQQTEEQATGEQKTTAEAEQPPE